MDKYNIPKGYILLVETKNGKERKGWHALAQSKGLKHTSAKTKYFEDVRIYKCTGCKKSYYIDELDASLDWSITNPGICYGVEMRCNVCWENNFYNDQLVFSRVLRGKKFLNTVIIGEELPNIPRKQQRRKKYPKKIDENVPLCERGMKIMKIEEF